MKTRWTKSYSGIESKDKPVMDWWFFLEMEEQLKLCQKYFEHDLWLMLDFGEIKMIYENETNPR